MRFNGGNTAEQWDTDKLKAKFGTKEGEVPFLRYIDMFSDTNSRIVIVVVDPGRRIIRHQADGNPTPPNIEFSPGFENVQHGQYAKNFDTDKSTQRMDIMDEINSTFAIIASGACVIDCTLVYDKVPGRYTVRSELHRLNDRKHMDRQDSLVDSRTAGFRMGKLRIIGDNDPRSGVTQP